MFEDVFSNSSVYILVFIRLIGMITFNPLLSRNNVPAGIRTGLAFLMMLLVTPGLPVMDIMYVSELDFLIMMFLELAVGFIIGSVFQLFYYMLFFVGDVMDTEFGLSMAKVFDPGTSVQMSISGNLLSIVFVLYIFATNSHLLLIQLFAESFDIIGVGAANFTQDLMVSMLNMFSYVFALGIRLAAPFIAAEFILEIALGVLMKLIPQIHVFVINIQLKILMGVALLLALAAPISSFLGNYIDILFENMRSALMAMG